MKKICYNREEVTEADQRKGCETGGSERKQSRRTRRSGIGFYHEEVLQNWAEPWGEWVA